MLRPALMMSALLTPSFALAQCPTQADLATGILITYNETDNEVYTNGADGNIVENGTKMYNGDQLEWVINQYGGAFESTVFERSVGYWHPTADFYLTYDFDLAATLPLTAGDVGGGTQTLEEPGYSEPATFSYSVHARPDITIGECSYTALDVYHTLLLPEGELGMFRKVFLPELGIAYTTDGFWSDGDVYNRVADFIEVVG